MEKMHFVDYVLSSNKNIHGAFTNNWSYEQTYVGSNQNISKYSGDIKLDDFIIVVYKRQPLFLSRVTLYRPKINYIRINDYSHHDRIELKGKRRRDIRRMALKLVKEHTVRVKLEEDKKNWIGIE